MSRPSMTIPPLRAQQALPRHEHGADPRQAGDRCRRTIDSRRANARVMSTPSIVTGPVDVNRRLFRHARNGRLIVERDAVARGFPPDRAVHRAAIHVTVAELRRHARATVPFPAPEGPSIAMTSGRMAGGVGGGEDGRDGKDEALSVLPNPALREPVLPSRFMRNMPLWNVCKRSSLRPASHRGARASS